MARRYWAPLFVFAVLAVGVGGAFCYRYIPHLGFIASPGDHTILAGRSSIRIYPEHGGLNYRVTLWSVTTGPLETPIRDGAPWFAYAESPRRIWVYDGDRRLVLHREEDRGGGDYALDVCGEWLRREVPPAIVSRLGARALDAMTRGRRRAGADGVSAKGRG